MDIPVPYNGNEPYIFISYSHKDSLRVLPVIERMQKDGYRVWYDNGISPGSEWDENIASHVKECSFFIAFMSDNYLASDNCKDELNYSRDLDKQQLIIYLDKVDLPPALAMRIGRNQAIMKYSLDDNDFYSKLYETQGIEHQHKDSKSPKMTLERPQDVHPKEARKNNKNKFILPLLAAALVISLVGAGLMWFKGDNNTPSADSQTVVSDTTAAEENQPVKVSNVEIYNDENLRISALGTELDSRYLKLKLSIENKTQREVYIYGSPFYLNGVFFNSNWSGITVPSGASVFDEVHFNCEEMKKYWLDPEDITSFESGISGYFTDNSASLSGERYTYYPYGKENAKVAEYVPAEGDFILLDSEEFTVAVRKSEKTYFYNEDCNYWKPEYIFINKSDESKTASIVRPLFNGYATNPQASVSIGPGKIMCADSYFYEAQYCAEEFGKALELSGEIFIGPSSEDWHEGARTYPFTIHPEGNEAAKMLKPREIKAEQIIYQDDFMIFAYLGTEITDEAAISLYYAVNISDIELEAHISAIRRDIEDGGSGTKRVLRPGDEALWGISYLQNYINSDSAEDTSVAYEVYDPDDNTRVYEQVIVDLYEIIE
ncbi:MAG: toll/interleukin-1 receptor domain-containing protein [Clostridia bacterium]|nr:toll/interleukin-1 receptor domain-containing protein [Clostridia bacterium]